METVLNIYDLHKSFASSYIGKTGKQEKEYAEILRGVNFTITAATVTALIGANGSGKSTLFNIISGLLPPESGNVTYHYENQKYNLCRMASYKHARIGIARLFQGSNIFPNLSVVDNMLVADNDRMGEQPWHIITAAKRTKLTERSRTGDAETILIELLGEKNLIWEKRHDPAGTLSLGQQRLLAFARLFMNEKATLYLLDEPCAGVNRQIRQTMTGMIHRLKSDGKTVLLIEHNIDFAHAVSDGALFIEDGKIAMHDEIDKVINSPRLQENYLGRKTDNTISNA